MDDRRHGDWASQDTLIRRAQRLEPLLHAYVTFAAPVDNPRGVLDGLPYAAKDIFAAPDRVPCGGLGVPLPPMDVACADVLRQLDEAGAMRVGYTALTEIAYEPSGHNPHGRPQNPWNPDFICGGSSSGSAVAVASRSVVSALGSDTGGSLRIPAQACGIAAWKPTWGTVSTRGAMPLAPTLDTIGFLMRHAADIVKAATVLANPRNEMVTSAVVIRDALAAAHPSVAKACQDGIDAIAAEDVEIEQRDGLALIDACDEPVFTIMQGEAARCHRALLDGDAIGATLRRRLAKGLDIDDATLAHAVAQRSILAAAFIDRVLQFAEIAILPVMPIRTPPVAECDPASAMFRARTLYELSRFTRFVNMIGFPAVAIPVGFDDRGMPVGLQMVGRPGADLGLLQLASHVQSHTAWQQRARCGGGLSEGDVMTTLVTGSSGFVGRAIMARLPDAIGLDPVAVSGHARDRRPVRPCAPARPDRAREGITHIIHAGGVSGPMVLADDPAGVIAINVTGSMNLLYAAMDGGVTTFVYCSSVAAIGNYYEAEPIGEDYPMRPGSTYGCSKAAMDYVLRGLWRRVPLDLCSLRLTAVYGPGRQTEFNVDTIVRAALAGKPARLDPLTDWPYVYVDDAAEAAIAACFSARAQAARLFRRASRTRHAGRHRGGLRGGRQAGAARDRHARSRRRRAGRSTWKRRRATSAFARKSAIARAFAA